MTILASAPTFVACGSRGVVHRVKGWRLPSALVPYVGTRYEDVPTPELLAYWQWFCGPERWLGHLFEMMVIEEVLDVRRGIEDVLDGREDD